MLMMGSYGCECLHGVILAPLPAVVFRYVVPLSNIGMPRYTNVMFTM